MIKVLAVSPSPEVTGAEQSLLNISSFLDRSAVRMTLAAPGGGTFEKRWRELGLEFHAMEVPVRQGLRSGDGRQWHGVRHLSVSVWRTVQAIGRLVKTVRAADADVLHSNLLMTHLDCVIAGLLTGTRPVLELHEIVAPGLPRQLLGAMIRLSGATIAISAASRDQVPTWARAKVVVVPQSVDARRFDNRTDDTAADPGWRRLLAARPDDRVVAAVGRVDPEKGLHILVRAVSRARSQGCPLQLAVVGSPGTDDGRYLAELTALGGELLGDAIRFLPHTEDIAGVLGAVDVLACPSFEEPFGMILLEAQLCAIPVVACRSGGPAEFIEDGHTGLLVRPGDVDDLAAALVRLAEDDVLRQRLARSGRERVCGEYIAPVRAGRVGSLYQRVAAR
ncbi:glycosyltransferase family 4 protein [Gordonia sp. NPDC057258]|uniref:glycosyltransferase family 4 protein n=1 Tax=unclassified Gordonia (in: high G+C Gram-positive bacteria) TaxID=2657482 RepID=UPI003644839C